MAGCYILFSESLNRFYVGATQEDLEARVLRHNTHTYGPHRFTAKAADWQVFLFIPAKNFKQAVVIERKIKKMKSSRYIRSLRQYPELTGKLIKESNRLSR